MGTMSSKGDPDSNKKVSVFWGLCMMGIAVVMLLSGGEDALSGLQSLTVLIALPFSVIMLGLLFSFVQDLRTDPHSIRDKYAKTALQYAVWHGLEDYGDDARATAPARISTPPTTNTRAGTSAPMKGATASDTTTRLAPGKTATSRTKSRKTSPAIGVRIFRGSRSGNLRRGPAQGGIGRGRSRRR